MSRSILIAGGYPHHLPLEVEKAFQHAGWRTHFFDTSPESPWHRPLVRPLRKVIHALRIQKHPQTLDDTRFSNLGWRSERWLQTVRETRPDLALVIRGNRFGLPWLRKAASVCPVVCWMIEPFSRLDRLIEEAQGGGWQKIFVYGRGYVDELRRHGIESEFYPHRAAETPPETRVRNAARRYDWCFLGSHSAWREECLAAVIAKNPNGFVLGPRWDKVVARNPVFQPVVRIGYYGKEEASAVYLDSRAGLDIAATAEARRNGVTMRVPELLACGCRVFTQPSEELGFLPWDLKDRATHFQTQAELAASLSTFLQEPAAIPDSAWELARQVSGYDGLVAGLESI